jgi:hypothetical protein
VEVAVVGSGGEVAAGATHGTLERVREAVALVEIAQTTLHDSIFREGQKEREREMEMEMEPRENQQQVQFS